MLMFLLNKTKATCLVELGSFIYYFQRVPFFFFLNWFDLELLYNFFQRILSFISPPSVKLYAKCQKILSIITNKEKRINDIPII